MGNPGNDRRIDNIEFAVSDIARSRDFYDKAFGWSLTDYGPAYCAFTDGRLTGGLAKGSPHPGGPPGILYAGHLARPQPRLEAAGPKLPKDRGEGTGGIR